MKQFTALFIKELKEAMRSFKLIWMPLVFLSLGISDPLVNYYMEDIMGSVGNMPDGFAFSIPEFTPVDILIASTGQFQMIGLVVLVAVLASSISRERQNGTAVFLYSRPLKFSAYFLSKYFVALFVSILCVLLGYGGSIYYTTILFGDINLLHALYMLGGYSLWLSFAVAFTLCMSAAFKTAISMFMSLIIIVGGALIDSMIGSFWTYSPYKLANYSIDFVALGEANEYFIVTACITILLIIICVVVGMIASKISRKKIII